MLIYGVKVMLGKADRQIGFSDYWLENRIPKESYWNKMHDWILNNINDSMFQELYSYYGKPSFSPVFSFAAMLIQFEKGYSDREMEESSRFDDRVKYAMTAPRDFNGIDAVTLCDHRSRLFKSDIGKKILLRLINQAKEAGMFGENNLNIIDSFMVLSRASKQDTYTMIYKGIKMVLKVCSFYGFKKTAEEKLEGKDYDSDLKKPKIDWENKKEKEALLDRLVKDALKLIEYVESKASKDNADLIEVTKFLKTVATQDVYKDNDGNYKMTIGTAKDRVISTVDPEMRHGHKTSSKIQDGYKAEILTGGEKGELVIGASVMPANAVDGESMKDLLDGAKADGMEIKKLYGDSAYFDYEEIKKRNEETEFCVRIRKAVNKNGRFTKDEFEIDMEKGTVICPNKEIRTIDLKKLKTTNKEISISFGSKACDKCKLKDKCTICKNGRSITIKPNEEEILEIKRNQGTDEFKDDYSKRSNVERNISQLVSHGGRKGLYYGLTKTYWQILMVSINNNIKKIMSFIMEKSKGKLTGVVCPN